MNIIPRHYLTHILIHKIRAYFPEMTIFEYLSELSVLIVNITFSELADIETEHLLIIEFDSYFRIKYKHPYDPKLLKVLPVLVKESFNAVLNNDQEYLDAIVDYKKA